MSVMEYALLRCDKPKCLTLLRFPIDHDGDPSSMGKLREAAKARGWTTFSVQGLMTYTADYCPNHAGETHVGIRTWGDTPTPFPENVVEGTVQFEGKI